MRLMLAMVHFCMAMPEHAFLCYSIHCSHDTHIVGEQLYSWYKHLTQKNTPKEKYNTIRPDLKIC